MKTLSAVESLGASINSIFQESDAPYFDQLPIDEIHVEKQAREVFENENQPLAELGKALREAWLEPLVVSKREEGGYLLVAGERRLRAAKLEGIDIVPAMVHPTLTPIQHRRFQFFENNHRLNLSHMEAAKECQQGIADCGGDIGEFAKMANVSRSWVSKTLAFLDLGPEAKKLIDENLSADKNLIGTVRQIEKRDPAAAKEFVDKVRANPGQTKARTLANELKDKVKPPSKEKLERRATKAGTESMATPKNRDNEQGGPVSMFSSFGSQPLGSNEQEPDGEEQYLGHMTPMQALQTISEVEEVDLETRLRGIYMEGRSSATEDPIPLLLAGLRAGTYGTKDSQILNLVAFMQGALMRRHFDLQVCLEAVKPK